MKAEINLFYTDKSRPISITDNPRKATTRFVNLLKALGYPSLQPLIEDIGRIGDNCYYTPNRKSKEE
jgi:hypothetical protein